MQRSILLLTSITLLASSSLLSAADPDDQALLPVPNRAEQKQLRQLVGEIYPQVAAANRRDDQTKAAQKLLEEANNTNDDSNGRYVLLDMSRELAESSGDPDTAVAAIDALASSYQVDRFKLKLAAFKKLSDASMPQSQRRKLADHMLQAVDAAIERDAFDTVEQVMSLAVVAARKSRDFQFARQVVQKSKEIEQLVAQHMQVKSAIEKLDKNPLDPDANLAVGRYQCFVKGDWQTGLQMLALGSDDELKALADLELNEPTKAGDQVELADKWWEFSHANNGFVKEAAIARAAHWYTAALPQLAGLSEAKARARLDSAPATEQSSPSVDLLKVAKARGRIVAGSWRKTPQGLVSVGTDASGKPVHSILEIPHVPGEAYVLEATVTRLTGANVFGVWLTSGDGQFHAVFEAKDQGHPHMGIGNVDGKSMHQAGTHLRTDIFPTGHAVDLRIEVKTGEITLRAGNQQYRWSGDFSRLSNPEFVTRGGRTPRHIHILGYESSFLVSSFTIKTVNEINETHPKVSSDAHRIDLLRLVDPAKHVITGSWQRVPQGIVCAQIGHRYQDGRIEMSPIELPFDLPTSYTLSLDVTRLRGQGPLAIFLASGATTFQVNVDGAGGGQRFSGIAEIDGKWYSKNESRRNGRVFVNGKSRRIEIKVADDVIQVIVDGKELTEFTGSFQRLSNEREIKDHQIRNSKRAHLATADSRFLVSSIVLEVD